MRKNTKKIILRIENRRFEKRLRRKEKRRDKRRLEHRLDLIVKKELGNDFSYINILKAWLPKNVKFLAFNNKSEFCVDDSIKSIKEVDYLSYMRGRAFQKPRTIKVPSDFSLISNPKETYSFFGALMQTLILQSCSKLTIDYEKCFSIELSTQVILDIIIGEFFIFYQKCNRHPVTASNLSSIGGKNITNPEVKKLLFSVGSPAIHLKQRINIPGVIPYYLCMHDGETGTALENSERKDIDTTTLADYVLNSLKAMNKSLTPDKLNSLCTVIGEILINAEEHSTTKCRFSIGYFSPQSAMDRQCGIFRLAILNFGETMYEKFKSPVCPNKNIVAKMKGMSSLYTQRKFFLPGQLEEETLWTLYALQEGVTSIDPQKYSKRGNGSIQFIDSFFNIKGPAGERDDISKMVIISGNTGITFNGKYRITESIHGGEKYKYMTFNKSGNIFDKPDKKYVRRIEKYFPGTLISAEILLNEGDLSDERGE